MTGAWIGNLTALAPYQPIFVAITLGVDAGPPLLGGEGRHLEELAHRLVRVNAPNCLGEKVGLAVLPAGDSPPSGDEMLDHLYTAGLSKLDMPEYFIAMTDFPLTASGKILKRELAS